jgi:hypothetical protein
VETTLQNWPGRDRGPRYTDCQERTSFRPSLDDGFLVAYDNRHFPVDAHVSSSG